MNTRGDRGTIHSLVTLVFKVEAEGDDAEQKETLELSATVHPRVEFVPSEIVFEQPTVSSRHVSISSSIGETPAIVNASCPHAAIQIAVDKDRRGATITFDPSHWSNDNGYAQVIFATSDSEEKTIRFLISLPPSGGVKSLDKSN